MTIYTFVSKLTQYFSWLYYERQWAGWELLTIAIITLVLLLLIVRRQRRATAERMRASEAQTHSPIIGVKLADRKGIKDLSKDRLAIVPEREVKQKSLKKTTKNLEKFDKQIK